MKQYGAMCLWKSLWPLGLWASFFCSLVSPFLLPGCQRHPATPTATPAAAAASCPFFFWSATLMAGMCVNWLFVWTIIIDMLGGDFGAATSAPGRVGAGRFLPLILVLVLFLPHMWSEAICDGQQRGAGGEDFRGGPRYSAAVAGRVPAATTEGESLKECWQLYTGRNGKWVWNFHDFYYKF